MTCAHVGTLARKFRAGTKVFCCRLVALRSAARVKGLRKEIVGQALHPRHLFGAGLPSGRPYSARARRLQEVGKRCACPTIANKDVDLAK